MVMTATSRIPLEAFLSLQRRLFEHAHSKPLELKSLGIALEKEGRNPAKQYCSLDFVLLPFSGCRHLSSMEEGQRNALTAMFFANNYARVATAEVIAIDHNMRTSASIFEPHSDDYQVLFNETAEEYDHIICFHSLYRTLAEGTKARPFDGRGFPEFLFLLDFIEKARRELCQNGAGAAYLLLRYMANVSVKQTESFMHKGDDAARIHPLANEITEGHANDEARHFATSLEMGRHLFAKARPESRSAIRKVIRFVVDSYVQDRFNPDARHRGYYHRLSEEALALALGLPEFEGWPPLDQLQQSWRSEGAVAKASATFELSQRWAARAMHQLEEALALEPKRSGVAFEMYRTYL
jgi:hypothetical protein